MSLSPSRFKFSKRECAHLAQPSCARATGERPLGGQARNAPLGLT